MRWFFLFLLFSLATLSQSWERVFADDRGIGISVEPFLSDLSLHEGETERDFSVTISNASERDIVLGISAVDFGSLDDSAGNAFLGAGRDIERAYDVAEWIRLDASEAKIAAEGSAVVFGKILNLETLSPGGHYGAILFRIREGEDLAYGPANIAIDQRLSALVFLKKYGGERFEMDASRVETRRNFLGEPISADIVVENAGNIHIVPRGLVEVTDPVGRMVSKGVVNQDSVIVLPGMERSFPVALIPIEKSFIPGIYHVRVGTRFDGMDDFSFSERGVFAFPKIPAIMTGLLVVTVTGYAIYRGRKKRFLEEKAS